MTVSSSLSTQTFNCDGSTTVFTCPFRVLEASELVGYLITVATNESVALVNGTDFAVTGVGAANAVATTTLTYSNAYQVNFRRRTQRLQSTDYRDNDPFPAESHENALDRLTHVVQEIDTDVGRALLAPAPEVGITLPAAADRADRLLGFDSDGMPVAVAPTSGSAAELAADLANSGVASKGAGQVGMGLSVAYANGPRVANYLKSYVTPLAYSGCVGDGVADDSTYLAAALAAGKKEVVIPGGYTFLVDGNLSVPTGVRIVGEGKIKKKAGTVKPIFLLTDEAQDITFEGITIDGARASFTTGNAVPAIQGYLNQWIKVHHVNFENIIDVGVKLRNCAYLEMFGGRIFNVGENGVEIKNYDVDPRTGLAYTGTLPALQGGHRIVGVWLGKIDNGTGDGSGDGCGILVSASKLAAGTAYPVKGVSVEACHFLNVKRGFWIENNDAGCETEDATVSNCWFRGDVAGFGGDVKDGIGAIDVKRFKAIGNTIVNVGNMNVTVPGTSCGGIQISGSATDTVELLNNTIIDNTGNTHRMDYGINLAAGTRITVIGNRTEGQSDGTINVISANVSELVCHSNPGATATYSWSETITTHFKITDIPATATTALQPTGYADGTELTFPMPVRLVGMSVKLSATITGNVTFTPYTNGVARTNLNITQADIASGTRAEKTISTNNGVTIAAGDPIRVDAVSSGLATTRDAIVTLVFETSLKE